MCATNMQWALYGSILFECIALGHRTALFCYMPLQSYGALVSILSIMHLANHIADFGATNSIPPLLPYFSKDKQSFRTMMLTHTIMPHFPVATAISIATIVYFAITLPGQYTIVHPAILAVLIMSEIIGSFLRQFLYTIQDTKTAVSISLGLFCTRVFCLWVLLFGYSIPLTPQLILYSHLISAAVSIALKIWRMGIFYQKLPDDDASAETLSGYFFLSIKIPNYLLRLSRNLFNSNFLTPFFAAHFGLGTAGVFYFASKLSHFLVAVIKITIGYTGNGLLAASKKHSLEHTKKVFALLSGKLVGISLPLVALFIMGSPFIATYWYGQMVCQKVVILGALFLMLSIMEGFFILYECFYIIEHAASQLFIIKITELAVFYGLIQLAQATGPATILCGIISIRLTTLAIVTGLAYRQWKIAPAMMQYMRYIPHCAGLVGICILGTYFLMH